MSLCSVLLLLLLVYPVCAFNYHQSYLNYRKDSLIFLMKGDVTYPTTIKSVITLLTKSTQAALQSKKSRVAVELPPAVTYGVEDGNGKGREKEADKIKRSNREAARLFVEMFSIIQGTTVVLFPSEEEATVARNIWGSKYKGQVLSIDVPSPKGYGSLRSRKFSPQEQEQVLMATDGMFVPEGTEVLILAGPRAKDMKKIRKLCEKFGDGTLIILLNARLKALSDIKARSSSSRDKDSTGKVGAEEEEEEEPITSMLLNTFENIFTYAPPAVDETKVGQRELLLYHEFEGKWFLAERAGGAGDSDGNKKKSSGRLLDSLTSLGKSLGVVSPFTTLWEGDAYPSDDVLVSSSLSDSGDFSLPAP